MFGKLETSDLNAIVKYIKTYENEVVYLEKPIEEFKAGNLKGTLYGEMHEGDLRGLFYFSDKKVLCMHYSDEKVLGSLGILKAVKLHKPKYIKGVLSQIEAIDRLLCRAVSEMKLMHSKLMICKSSENLPMIETAYVLVDGMHLTQKTNGFMEELLQDLKFFIEVERHFGRPVKAVNDILKDFKKMLHSQNYLLYLHQNKIVAQGLIEEETDRFGILGGIYVSKAYRGQGLGRNVSSFLTNRILERGKTSYLFVVSENLTAIGLYEKIGYKLVCDYGVLTIVY
ncbi:GNAT family N-acetyltransferase [Fusibacter tunisiensis]|uniref:GNAT superfamily N-acetyltransferase n=1 Tax=Fusibacter tunisiensis TaxID=1008308 RepID=A0ABS2MS22_9FIRM|nr:GNAT family N-acetyltransferase [Fusibacter tunisiensis]MBM7562184.1 GNAT superfamily N-acetyltransferase [Fusibacter tunisiensis]